MSINYQSLFGTTDISADSINATNVNCTAISATTATVTTLITSGIYTVNPNMTQSQIQAIIDNPSYTHVIFSPGTYNIGCLNIRRNNIVLEGQMCTLYMPTVENNPNILVGDKETNPPTLTYNSIVIKNFILEGNKTNQTSETMRGYSWIYNNCITINYCSNVVVENCAMNNSISGGMTITYNSNNIKLINCSARDNFYDGYTAYGSTNVSIIGCSAKGHNNGSGASFDTNMQYMTFDGCVFTQNNLGIFARDSHDIVITGCIVSTNQMGMFLTGYSDPENDRGPSRWVITGNTVTNNTYFGMYLQSCTYFTITGNVISENFGDGISFNNDTIGYPVGVCCYNNVSGNIITSNRNSGLYSGPDNCFEWGGRSNFMSLNIIKNNVNAQQIRGDFTAWTVDDDTQLNTERLCLHNYSGNYTNITASELGNCTFVFPSSIGSNKSLLQTDGSGKSSWTDSPVVNTITVNTNLNLTGSGTTAQYGIFSINASSSSGGCMLDSYSGSIYFKGGDLYDSFRVTDSSNRSCFRVYNNGSNGTISVKNGVIEIATSTGSANIGASLSGGTCNFNLPGTNGFNGYLLQTNGSGSTSWTGSPSVDAVILKNSGYTTTLSGGSTGTTNFRFPSTTGTSGQLLKTDGSGNTSWSTPTIVSATSFLIGTGSAGTGSLEYDGPTSTATSGIISNLGTAEALPAHPKGYIGLTIAGFGNVAIPVYDQSFF